MGELSQVELRETLDRTHVAIELNKAGGFGDILHVAKLAGTLAGDPSLYVTVHSNEVTDRHLEMCTEEFGQAEVVGSSGKVEKPDILITTILPKTRMSGGVRIHVEEFSHQEGGGAQGADYVVATGLGFNPEEHTKIQAGITDSQSLREKIPKREEVRSRTRLELQEKLVAAGISDRVVLEEAQIGVLYTSSLSTNYHYIAELSRVATQLGRRVVVFCIGSSTSGYESGFSNNDPKGEQLREILDHGHVSYYNLDDIEDLQYDRREDSAVTVINLGRSVPHALFEDLLLTADFPSVVTGDQSLAEAIQISAGLPDVPPFLYYCYFGNKPIDYFRVLAASDPMTASYAAAYLLGEHIPEHSAEIIPAVQGFVLDTQHSLGAFFVDQQLQDGYSRAFREIPEKVRQAKSPYVPRADLLVWESDAISALVKAVSSDDQESIDMLRVRNREQ